MLKNNNPLVLQYRLAAANKKKTKLSTTSAALQNFHQNVVPGNTKSLDKITFHKSHQEETRAKKRRKRQQTFCV
jgi:hypothetical protein